MATKKELVEAQSFSRRRLLTAFVSGAPGGRELEPTSPVRGVVAGLVIAVLVVAGGFASGLFNRGLPNGWDNGAIIVVKDNAARYVSQDGSLRPVTNMASARLLVPSDATIFTVGANLIEGVERLGRAGITGAPDSLPELDALVTDGWLACVALDGTTRTSLRPTAEPDEEGDGADPVTAGGDGTAQPSVLVTVGDQLHLVQGGSSYEIAAGPQQAGVLRALGLPQESARGAREEWLALLEQGDAMAPFEVEGAGGTPEGPLGAIDGVTVGRVVALDGSDQRYVALASGRLAPLSELAAAVYATGEAGSQEPVVARANQLSGVEDATPEESPVPTSWPTAIGTPLTTDEAACAQLDAEAFAARLVPGDVTETGGVDVEPGTGALALFAASPDTTAGPVRFVDENGIAYAVDGGRADGTTREDALRRLFAVSGDDAVDPTPVPYAWGDLFTSGPTLSIEAAQQSRTEVADEDGGDTGSGDEG